MVQSIEDSPLQNISNRINWGRIQTLILYIKFPGFFRWAAIYKTAIKVSVRVQRIIEPFLGCQSSLGVILREKVIFDFFSRIGGGGMSRHVCSTFFEKEHPSPKEKIPCFREKVLPDNTRKIIFQCYLFEKTIFSEHLKKISYFYAFFEKDHLSFSVQEVRSYFR